MKRLHEKQFAFKGGITPFFSLVFILLLALVGAMIQSASIQSSKSIKRAEMNLALENLFAEYHKELLQDYELFVREGNDEQKIKERLEFYGIVNTQHEIIESTLLSDLNGQAFYEQAVASMGGTTETISIPAETMSEAKENEVEVLDKFLQEEGLELPAENNPIAEVNQLRQSNLLSLIYPNQEQLSNRNIELEGLASHRTLEKGVGHSKSQSKDSVKNQTLFALYLTEHFNDMLDNSQEHALVYEVEYLLAGKSSDQENLKYVAEKILKFRIAVNYAYLFTDETRQMEAEAVALGLSTLAAAPEAASMVKQALLFAWSYGESIVDLRSLMEGERVPIVKTSETWQLQLSNIFQLESNAEIGKEAELSDGITYREYLKVLLFAERRETLCMRALDLLELNTGIQADGCITQLKIQSICQLQRGVTYTFQTNYKYK